MKQFSPYIFLYFVVIVLQIFFFNNLTISIALTPLIYIAFILFLPIRTTQLNMLLLGVLLGVSADVAMGLAGVNTIVTIFMSYIRIYLLSALVIGEVSSRNDIILHKAVKQLSTIRRALVFFVIILIHHILFFVAETLSIDPFPFWIFRTLLSSVVTTIFVVLLYDIFRRLFFYRNI